MKRKVVIEDLKNEDIGQMLSLHNNFYGDCRTIDQWKWEYQKYSPDKYVFKVAKDIEKVVGNQGAMPIPLNVGNTSVLTAKSENSFISEEYRGLLFFKLYQDVVKQVRINGMRYLWGFSAQVPEVWKALGFSLDTECMRDYVCVLSVIRTFREIKNKQWKTYKKGFSFIASILLGVYRVCIRILTYNNISSKKYSLRFKINASDLSSFYASLKTKNEKLIHLDFTEEFFNWRVIENPILNYKVLAAFKKKDIKAYIIYNMNGNNSVYISDFSFNDKNAGKLVLKHFFKECRHCKAGYIFFLGNTKNRIIKESLKLLKMFGFIDSKNKTAFVFQDIDKEDTALFDVEDWYLNGLWTEGYTM